MDDAEWFVLLASPDAVASEWVNRELSHWIASKSANRILLVVTDGTWEWDTTARALVGTAVPEPLRAVYGDEPRHVDLRWARVETDLDLRNSRFRDVVAELAAPMHGVDKDELESEDIRLHRRARRLARGATSLLVVLLVLAIARRRARLLQQRRRAQHQAAKARRESAAATQAATGVLGRGLAAEALNALHGGQPDLARAIGDRGLPDPVEHLFAQQPVTGGGRSTGARHPATRAHHRPSGRRDQRGWPCPSRPRATTRSASGIVAPDSSSHISRTTSDRAP